MTRDDIAYAAKLWLMAGNEITKCKRGRYVRPRSRATLKSRVTRTMLGWQGS